MIHKIKLGCIADDFTGAGDAASFLAEGGLRTILVNGIPGEDFLLPDDCEAVVIALKSRTQKKEDAIRDSLAGIRWLAVHGTEKFYFKYCSTFDSTPEGNIGPVTDAILEELGEKMTILCPALPANGRTVQNGILYVNGVRLEDSSMRNHPLTPMRESRISLLMKPQGKYESLELSRDLLGQSEEKVRELVEEFAHTHTHGYLIPDHIDDEDARRIVRLFGNLRFLTGGSGILKAEDKQSGGHLYMTSRVDSYVGVVRRTAGFDGCSHGTLNYGATEYNCWAGGVRHLSGGAYTDIEYSYGSKIAITVKQDNANWDTANGALYQGSKKLK